MRADGLTVKSIEDGAQRKKNDAIQRLQIFELREVAEFRRNGANELICGEVPERVTVER